MSDARVAEWIVARHCAREARDNGEAAEIIVKGCQRPSTCILSAACEAISAASLACNV